MEFPPGNLPEHAGGRPRGTALEPRWPLLSLPRFGIVLFPCFLALATLGGRPRVHTAILVVSSIMLGIAVTQWALWQWVA